MKKEGSITVKLIEPVEGNLSLMNFVTRTGGFHHLCFRCDDVNDKISFVSFCAKIEKGNKRSRSIFFMRK
jgi:hypothetical protein